jgi:hypothetical protein
MTCRTSAASASVCVCDEDDEARGREGGHSGPSVTDPFMPPSMPIIILSSWSGKGSETMKITFLDFR